ncbi:MAG: DUF4097 family beta strand repeat-containing protein, partial [Planctomycetota bacterium]
IEDVAGKGALAETSFGDVVLRRVACPVVAVSSSGRITLAAFTGGSCSLKTSFGDIDAEGVFATLSAVTSSGRVRARCRSGSRVTEPWRLESSFGDVVWEVADGLDCSVTASTSFGEVRSDLAVVARRTAKGSLEGDLGKGGVPLLLKTSSGDVTMRRLPD